MENIINTVLSSPITGVRIKATDKVVSITVTSTTGEKIIHEVTPKLLVSADGSQVLVTVECRKVIPSEELVL